MMKTGIIFYSWCSAPQLFQYLLLIWSESSSDQNQFKPAEPGPLKIRLNLAESSGSLNCSWVGDADRFSPPGLGISCGSEPDQNIRLIPLMSPRRLESEKIPPPSAQRHRRLQNQSEPAAPNRHRGPQRKVPLEQAARQTPAAGPKATGSRWTQKQEQSGNTNGNLRNRWASQAGTLDRDVLWELQNKSSWNCPWSHHHLDLQPVHRTYQNRAGLWLGKRSLEPRIGSGLTTSVTWNSCRSDGLWEESVVQKKSRLLNQNQSLDRTECSRTLRAWTAASQQRLLFRRRSSNFRSVWLYLRALTAQVRFYRIRLSSARWILGAAVFNTNY